GSTNALIHVIAMARRAGIPLTLDRFDALARDIPVLANVRPSGEHLMEDFYYAGGLRGLLGQLRPLLALDRLTVNGRRLGQNLRGAAVSEDTITGSLEWPVATEACAVLRGNLAPEGAVMKPSAAEPRLLSHAGPALAFDGYDAMAAAMEREDL